jgi:hypothetical protein
MAVPSRGRAVRSSKRIRHSHENGLRTGLAFILGRMTLRAPGDRQMIIFTDTPT